VLLSNSEGENGENKIILTLTRDSAAPQNPWTGLDLLSEKGKTGREEFFFPLVEWNK